MLQVADPAGPTPIDAAHHAIEAGPAWPAARRRRFPGQELEHAEFAVVDRGQRQDPSRDVAASQDAPITRSPDAALEHPVLFITEQRLHPSWARPSDRHPRRHPPHVFRCATSSIRRRQGVRPLPRRWMAIGAKLGDDLAAILRFSDEIDYRSAPAPRRCRHDPGGGNQSERSTNFSPAVRQTDPPPRPRCLYTCSRRGGWGKSEQVVRGWRDIGMDCRAQIDDRSRPCAQPRSASERAWDQPEWRTLYSAPDFGRRSRHHATDRRVAFGISLCRRPDAQGSFESGRL